MGQSRAGDKKRWDGGRMGAVKVREGGGFGEGCNRGRSHGGGVVEHPEVKSNLRLLAPHSAICHH